MNNRLPSPARWYRRRLAVRLDRMALSRLTEHGPMDARGAAIYDVSAWLVEDRRAR